MAKLAIKQDNFKNSDEDAALVEEAKKGWKTDYDWESTSRQTAVQDYKFANGDSYNNFQWPGDVLDARGGPESDKPVLTINKVRQNCLLITNDMKKNKPAITFRPTGNGATAQSALIWNGLARHIESQSSAQDCYDKASNFMVQMGFGYWRVKTDFINDKSFDQDIFIRQILDPWAVLLDSGAKEPDKADATRGFITEDVPRDLWDVKYPKFRGLASQVALEDTTYDWITRDHIRVAEYYKQALKRDTLYAYLPEGSPQPVMLFKSEIKDKDLLEKIQTDCIREREVIRKGVTWHLIAGDRLVDEAEWLGQIIPIVEISGETTIIDHKFDRKGHVRYLLDQQRMYNYFSSSGVEFGALQTKTPWIAPAEAIEEHEEDWNASNVQNKSVLVYNGKGDDGSDIPPPQRVQPPVSAPLCIEGMKIASDEIMSASGQYQAALGMPSNERSAKAIMQREAQGDLATFHYPNSCARGIRKTGKIILEVAPKIYDTQRVLQILQEDGKTLEVMMNPSAQKAYEETQQQDAMSIQRIFNPAIGSYEVMADSGPDWGTKREESFNAFSMLLGQAPQLIPLLADLLMRSGDFPMAETAAERLYRMLPPQAKGEGPSPQEQAMQQRISALSDSLMTLLQEKSKLQLELKGKDQQKLVDAFNAVTQRLKLTVDQGMDASDMKELVQDTLREALGIDVTPAAAASEPTLAAAAGNGQGELPLEFQTPPAPQGAHMGPDGRMYMKDYGKSGAYRAV